jgi:hypothetical protein
LASKQTLGPAIGQRFPYLAVSAVSIRLPLAAEAASLMTSSQTGSTSGAAEAAERFAAGPAASHEPNLTATLPYLCRDRTSSA